MSKKLLSSDSIAFWVYNASLSIVSELITGNCDKPSPIVFYFFVLMMFYPELSSMLSKGYRKWIRRGIEGDDGKFDTEDVTNLRINYNALWMLRLCLLFGLLIGFYKADIPVTFFLVTFFGAFGMQGLDVLKTYLQKK